MACPVRGTTTGNSGDGCDLALTLCKVLRYGKCEFRHADVVCLCLVYILLQFSMLRSCSLLMMVKNAKGDHMEEAYTRAGLRTICIFKICLKHEYETSVGILSEIKFQM